MEVKYKIDRVRLKVRIKRQPTDPRAYWENTLTEEDVEEINNFVKQHHLGIRVAYDMWKFKDKQSLTMFMLKYGGEIN